MGINFNWTCPYCNHSSTITDSNCSDSLHTFNMGNKHGPLGIATKIITCPNDNCREYTITGELKRTKTISSKLGIQTELIGSPLMSWQLRPESFALQFPDYVPKPIKEDYEEACRIRELSPKASATLSRRCLQGIIRDFWGIRKSRLADEINALKENNNVDPITLKAIDSVRALGNIGAHMEKDINIIIDIEPNEAQLLLKLIENLINDWYIARHEKQLNFENIIRISKDKKGIKKSQ